MTQIGYRLLLQKLGTEQEKMRDAPPYTTVDLTLTKGEITALVMAIILLDTIRAAVKLD